MAYGKFWRTAALGFGLTAAGAWGGQVLVPEQSTIEFIGRQMGVPADGHFQKFTVDAALDPAALEKSTIRVAIDMNSVTLPAPDFTVEVKRKRWFDVAAFPEATFESKQLRALDDGRYEVRGVLTIKGVGREIAAPFTLRQEGQDWTADGRFDIKRLDFNIGDGPWADTDTVANEVQIRFKFRLRPQP